MTDVIVAVLLANNYSIMVTDNIKGKRILLMCDKFYDYDEKIKNTLLHLGAKDVVLKNAKFFPGSFREKISFKTFIFFIRNPFERSIWTNKLIKEINDKKFDIFLCIENMSFKKRFINYLKSNNPEIKTYLFLWDTFETQQYRFRDYLPLFDYKLSFDRGDCKKYGLEYLPDFYLPLTHTSRIKYDLSFFGAMHPGETANRAELLHKINMECKRLGLNSYLYLKYTPISSKYKKWGKLLNYILGYSSYNKVLKRYISEPYMHSEAVSTDVVDAVYSQSKVILDISHPNRQGMTINCITALASGKKLITTNKFVTQEPYYSPLNICVIDESTPRLDASFFCEHDFKVDMSYLRIDNWLKILLNR